jgi:hypothetical protein
MCEHSTIIGSVRAVILERYISYDTIDDYVNAICYNASDTTFNNIIKAQAKIDKLVLKHLDMGVPVNEHE